MGHTRVPRRKCFEVFAHLRLLGVRDGEDGEVAVDHAEDDAVAVGGTLQGAQI